MKKRLQTVLAYAGVASRRQSAKLIEEGYVRVDGQTVTEKGMRVDPGKQVVLVNGRPLPGEEKKHYFLFNKPGDVISTAKDTHGRKKVTDFFKSVKARLYPVGRLDKDTTGALIMTNDGSLAHKLAHPSFEVDKEYRVTVRESASAEDTRRIEKGVELDGRNTVPCSVELVKKGPKGAVYSIKLHEGRKRQIRRMFEAVGSAVVKLERVRYAGLTLKGLKQGEFRELTEREIKRLKELTI